MPAAAVVGGAALAGSVISATSASSAAKKEAKAANSAAGLQHQAYEQAAATLSPYVSSGTTNLNSAENYMANNALLNGTDTFNAGNLGIPYASSTGAFNFTGKDLATTPGYQFTLQQGQNAVNNAQAASGLGVSGAQAKALASYTTGLADSTYNSQYSNALNAYNSSYANALNSYNTNYNTAAQQYNRYSALASQGLQAGEALSSAATGTANAAGNYLTQAGQANAAGTVGVANALSGGLNSAAGAYLTANLLSGTGSTGSTGSSSVDTSLSTIPSNALTSSNPYLNYSITPTNG